MSVKIKNNYIEKNKINNQNNLPNQQQTKLIMNKNSNLNNIYNTSVQKNKNSNNKDFSKKMKSFSSNSVKKSKDILRKYNNFVIKHESKIYSYYFYISILIFVLMFFVSLFINSKLGYSLNGVELEWNYGLVTAGIVFGSICLILYLPIFVFSITQFIDMIKNKKFNFMFYWMIVVQVFNLYVFLTAIIYSILNYRLFFIHEILYIIMLVAFWSLHNRSKISFRKLNKNNNSKNNIVSK